MVKLPDVTAYLHDEIPLSKAMGVKVEAWDGRKVTLTAPLTLNQNHADTAFGGSISTMGILAGYTLLHVLFVERALSMRILIQKSATDYLRPVDHDLVAEASCAEEGVMAEFFESIRRKRRGRMELASQVLSNKVLAATHTGLFVAMIY